jgi:hypothetical protein
MIAHYNKRIKELLSTPSEMYDYMARSAPFLMEYESSRNKNDLFKKFMVDVENVSMNTSSTIENDFLFLESTTCENCLGSNLFYDYMPSDTVCSDCGFAQYTFSGEKSYKEEQDTDHKVVYSYKRENHFNEWLAQFQAKEVTNIPPDVFDLLKKEFKKKERLLAVEWDNDFEERVSGRLLNVSSSVYSIIGINETK